MLFFLILFPALCPACVCFSVLEPLLCALFPNVFVSGIDSEPEFQLWLLCVVGTPGLGPAASSAQCATSASLASPFGACLVPQTFPKPCSHTSGCLHPPHSLPSSSVGHSLFSLPGKMLICTLVLFYFQVVSSFS